MSDIWLNRNTTNELKGIAIVLVILGHLCVIHHAGAWGVTIFLIISGFGLTQSYSHKGLSNYFNKRLLKVLFPYSIVSLIWILVDFCIGVKHSLVSMLLTVFGINFTVQYDKSMWYVTFILIWYLLFYMVFRFLNNNIIKICVLFASSIILYELSKINLFPHDVGMYLYVFSFPIGVCLGLCYKKVIDINSNKVYICQIVMCIIFLFLFIITTQIEKAYLFENLFFSVVIITFINILSMHNISFKFVSFLGSVSYEMYLFEFMFLSRYRFIFELNINIWIQRLIYIGFIIILGALFNQFIQKTQTRILHHYY